MPRNLRTTSELTVDVPKGTLHTALAEYDRLIAQAADDEPDFHTDYQESEEDDLDRW